MKRISMIKRFVSRVTQSIRFRFEGQISHQNEIGRWIQLLASLEENRTIVEIGTWNGLGSTSMILKGLESKNSTESKVMGFESNKKLFETAKKNLRGHPEYELIFGSIVTEDELDSKNLSEIEVDWIQNDISGLKEAPYKLSVVPDQIDLLILDGGEFSTFAEFNKLNSRVTGWIVLDDTNTRKCKGILKELQDDGPWKIVFSSIERNGTAVLRRSNNED